MNLLVVAPAGNNGFSRLWVERNLDRVIHGPFESWAIDDGRRVTFVHKTLGRRFESLRIAGNFMNGEATYGLDYHELVALITQHMGPTDRQRVGALPKSHGSTIVWVMVFCGLAMFLIGLFIASLKFALAMAIIPVILAFLGRR